MELLILRGGGYDLYNKRKGAFFQWKAEYWAWMLAKKPYIVPIPGSRKESRIRENLGAAEVILTAEEVAQLDEALEHMAMSPVFGGHSAQ